METFGVIGWPLILGLVIGLCELAKKAGVSGNYLLLLSLGLGVVFGTGLEIYLSGAFSFASLFTGIVYGLLAGLSASKVYDVAKETRQN